MYLDLLEYSKLIETGGIMFGDDYTSSWPGVIRAVNRFSKETGKPVDLVDNNYWVIRF